MAIDTSMYARVGAGADIAGAYSQGVADRQQAKLSDLNIKEKVLDAQKKHTLGELGRKHYKNGQLDRPGFSQDMANAGYAMDLPGMQEQWTRNDTAISTYKSGENKRRMDALDYTHSQIGSLLSNPQHTASNVISLISNLASNGFISPEEGAQLSRDVPADFQQRTSWLRNYLIRAQQAQTQLQAVMPSVQALDLGGTTQMVDANPITNPGIVGKSYTKTLSPGEQASVFRAEQEAAQEQGQIVSDGQGGVMWVDKRTGIGRPVTDSSGNPIAGKAGSEERKRVQESEDALAILGEAEQILGSGKATSGMLGSWADAGLGAIGVSTEGAQTSAQLKALQGRLVSLMPKMSGPQSDKDVLLYREMAGQIGDSNIPVATRLAAIKTIRSLMERYAGVHTQSAPGAAPAADGGVLGGGQAQGRQIVRTGTLNGRRVAEYSDGSSGFIN